MAYRHVGRPLKFESVEALEKAITEYFTSCQEHWADEDQFVPKRDPKGNEIMDSEGRVQYDLVTRKRKVPAATPTISALAVHLDTSRETLLDYEKGKHDNGENIEGHDVQFSDTIKRAKQTIQSMTERLLVDGGAHPSGIIFSLKNNYGWKDRSELDVTSKGDKIGGELTPEAQAKFDRIMNGNPEPDQPAS